jgi:predicted DNA binding protein
VRQIGNTTTALAEQLGMSQQAITYAVRRGQKIVREKDYRLIER